MFMRMKVQFFPSEFMNALDFSLRPLGGLGTQSQVPPHNSKGGERI